MEANRNSFQVWWVYDQDITAVAAPVIPVGCNSGGFAPAGSGVGLVRDLRYFAFSLTGVYTTATLTFTLQIGNVSSALVTWFTHPHSGSGNVDTIHNVAAPYGNTEGILTIATQFLRLNVNVGGAGNVTSFFCMARAWKE